MIKTMEQWLTGKRLLIILTIAAALVFVRRRHDSAAVPAELRAGL